MIDPLWVFLDQNNIVLEVSNPSPEQPGENYFKLNDFYTRYNIVTTGWKKIDTSILFNFIPSTEEQFNILKSKLLFLLSERANCEREQWQSDSTIIGEINTKEVELKDILSQFIFGDENNSKQILYQFEQSIYLIDY